MNQESRIKTQKGFTLIEILVAVTIFGIFIAIASQSLVGVIRQQQKTNVLRLTQQNIRSILETVSREGRNANGEFDRDNNRIVHAYQKDGEKLALYFTDFKENNIENREVKKIEYFLTDGILHKDIYTKKVGENQFGDAKENLILNDLKDIVVSEFGFEVNADINNYDKPPIINNLIIKADSGSGLESGRAELKAKVELSTSITSRGY